MIWLKIKKLVFYSFLHPRYLAQRELWKVLRIEGPRLHGKLLDVGCGQKPYMEVLKCVEEYIGLDVPTSMHDLSRVDVIGTAMTLPFQDCAFDNILCTEVLEHVPEPLFALKEMHRVTNSGGILLLTVPLSEQLHEEPYDFYRFTVYGLEHILNKSSWKILRIYQRGGGWLELGYRLSSYLYQTAGATKRAKGALQPRLVLGPFVVIVCALIQLSAMILDKVWKSSLSTIGYAVVAERK